MQMHSNACYVTAVAKDTYTVTSPLPTQSCLHWKKTKHPQNTNMWQDHPVSAWKWLSMLKKIEVRLLGPVKRDMAEFAFNVAQKDKIKFVCIERSDMSPVSSISTQANMRSAHRPRPSPASRFMISSNSIVSSMSRTVSRPTLLHSLSQSLKFCWVYKMSKIWGRTNEEGKPGKRWNWESSSRSFRAIATSIDKNCYMINVIKESRCIYADSIQTSEMLLDPLHPLAKVI